MKNAIATSNPAMLSGFLFLALFLIAGTSTRQTVEAQSYVVPPSNGNSGLEGCYYTIVRNYANTVTIYQGYRDKAIQLSDEHEAAVIGLIGLGTAGATYLIPPGPWTFAALTGGAVSLWAVTSYYNSQRAKHRQDYNNRITALNTAAETAEANCLSEHENGGDAENNDEEQYARGSGRNVQFVGGSRSIGGQPRTRTSTYPAN